MNLLARISLLLVIVLVSLSAYLRLAHSGIGCADWPACYGRIGEPAAAAATDPSGGDAYLRLVQQANEPLAWAQPLHRLVASVLGLCVLFLTILAFRNRRHRTLALTLLGLTVFLAVLGTRSGSLHSPAVVMGNLTGGFAMLGLLGWLVFARSESGPAAARVPGTVVVAAIGLLILQIVLGGLTSANFAALACQSLPDCHGRWLPGAELMTAFDLTRQHSIESGRVSGGAERVAIHMTHRLGAVLAALMAAVAGAMAVSRGLRVIGTTILVVLAAEFSVGVASVLGGLPISLAVAHNWLAGLLLLSLLKLAADNRRHGRA